MAPEPAKRACTSCKVLKIKCNRSVPSCEQCDKSGKICSYPDNKRIRFRDETQSAGEVAIRKWRARSAKSQSPTTTVVEPMTVQFSLLPALDELARHRFIYDFAQTNKSPFARDLKGIMDRWADGLVPESDKTSVHYALDAVAFANFSRRQKAYEASNLATKMHGLAALKLRDSVSDLTPALLPQHAVTATLLGLYQNIRPEPSMAGSWIYHFCGAVTIAMSPDHGHELFLTRLLTMQALHASFRINHMVHLPPRILKWMDDTESWQAVAARAAWETAELVIPDQGFDETSCALSPECVDQAFAMHTKLNNLEAEFMHQIPFISTWKEPDDYPKWFHPVSKHAGFPPVAHSYKNVQSLLPWQVLRFAQFNLLVRLFASDLGFIATAMLPSMLAKAAQLLDDICASVYWILSTAGDGRPNKPTSIQEVPSSAAYVQIVILQNMRESVECSPLLSAETDQRRLGCIKRIITMFSEGLGMSEPVFFDGVDDTRKRELVERLDSFRNSL